MAAAILGGLGGLFGFGSEPLILGQQMPEPNGGERRPMDERMPVPEKWPRRSSRPNMLDL